jgi:transcriptional regulator with XRE-family HTH domain
MPRSLRNHVSTPGVTRVNVGPELLRSARERAGMSVFELGKRFPKLVLWERGEARPTLKQLEEFAKITHTPIGFLFLPEPPEERLPIRDLRTVVHGPARPSPDLLDTIYAMQRRQDWLREERLECEAGPLELVGSARLSDDPSAVGREMRRITGLGEGWASAVSTWEDAVSELRRRIEQLGVMDLRLVDCQTFFDFYEKYTKRERQRAGQAGGDFDNNQNTRVGARFATSVIDQGARVPP